MTAEVEVRRVRLHEWREVRDLRWEAVGDDAAAIAFLTTPDQERARSDDFWRDRTARAALGDNAAQFVAIDGDGWAGTVTVLLRAEGDLDHLGRVMTEPRADVVGVYVAPRLRGTGILTRLLALAAQWSASHGIEDLTLDVHIDNARAQAAYRKAGFVPTGATFTSAIGPELEMRRSLRPSTPPPPSPTPA